jgi:hypothetical protein
VLRAKYAVYQRIPIRSQHHIRSVSSLTCSPPTVPTNPPKESQLLENICSSSFRLRILKCRSLRDTRGGSHCCSSRYWRPPDLRYKLQTKLHRKTHPALRDKVATYLRPSGAHCSRRERNTCDNCASANPSGDSSVNKCICRCEHFIIAINV